MKLSLIAVLFSLIFSAAYSAVDLAKNGRTDYKIYLAADAVEPERFAAEELQKYLLKISGVKLEITNNFPENAKAVLVGNSSRAADMLKGIDFASLAPDEIILRKAGDAIILAGTRPRGAIYAVYEFLETELGVRFWSLGVEQIPKMPDITINSLDYRYHPPFSMREAFSYETNRHPEISVKLRNNGHYNLKISEKMGGHYTYGFDFCHTFNLVLPPAVYLKSNPEFYTLLSGNRWPVQLCLSNKEMRKEFIRKVYEFMDKNPQQKLIALSQMDGGLEWHSCQCPDCTKMRKEIGGSTDMLIDFINEVADAVKAKDPSVRIETLAYSYTAAAPKTRVPRDNVIIRLCISGKNPFKPLTDKENETLLANYKEWSKITSSLSIWLYKVNFSSVLDPYPNLYTFKPDLKYFADTKNIFAMFVQGMQRGHSEFDELRTYLSSKLQWNPELDDHALIQEFLQGFYGPGAEAVSSYIELANQASQRPYRERQPLNMDELLKSRTYLSEALDKIPQDSPYYKRLRKVYFSINCALASRRELNWNDKNPQHLAYKKQVVPEELLQEIESDAKLLSIGYGSEHGLWPDKLKELKMNLVKPVSGGTKPQIGRSLQDGDWVEWTAKEMRLTKAAVCDDAKATGNTAVVFDHEASGWVVSVPLPRFSGFEPVRKDIWIAARCEAGKADGKAIAFTAGIHNSSSNSYQTRPNEIPYTIDSCKGEEYKWLKVGTAELLNDSILLFITAKPDKSGKKIYIDRVIAVDPVK